MGVRHGEVPHNISVSDCTNENIKHYYSYLRVNCPVSQGRTYILLIQSVVQTTNHVSYCINPINVELLRYTAYNSSYNKHITPNCTANT